MAWNVKAVPAQVVVCGVSATVDILLDRGAPISILLSYTDEDGQPFAKARSFALSLDGLKMNDMQKGTGVTWVPPVGSAKDCPAAIAYLISVVQSLVDQGLAAPKR